MGNPTLTENSSQKLIELLEEFKSATSLTKPEKANRLMGQIDILCDSVDGLGVIYNLIEEISEGGIFNETPWADPSKLVAGLVHWTLKSGHPNSTIELLSELRLMAIAKGDYKTPSITAAEADSFIQEVLVGNLEFVFNDPVEETRLTMSEHELSKVHNLFKFLSNHIHLDDVKDTLAEELTLICEQRPVVTEKQRKIIALVKEKIELDPNKEGDQKLLSFQRSIYRPAHRTINVDVADYRAVLEKLNNTELYLESQEMGESMLRYGLVSAYHAVLLKYLIEKEYFRTVPICLGLSPVGESRWQEHTSYLSKLILSTVHVANSQCIYGLAKMLENGIIARQAVRSGLSNLGEIKLNSEVEERILKSSNDPRHEVTARQYLIGALFRILGQPLGVGQGNNPTCQSARGISMWSQHAPAKLINMVQTAAVTNDITFRFEGQEIKASTTGKGLVQNLDYNLDAVSVTLVPMLDRIYNEMMLRGSGRAEDPHKWVNPALYGQWIQIGFASAYDYLSNAIVDFDGFVRVFYAMCHPDYNGNHRLIYPNPVGIFITSSKGDMLGFHAVSLLRVDKDPSGEYRAYFLNPNNEGRQDWGQGVKPSVYGNGEKHGESSLPIHHFAARTYAFHFNDLEAELLVDNVPAKEVEKVRTLAKDSWGKSYTWLETKKKW
ncbi:hypothetical protein SAMN05661096_00434 [Marivirga sericea]|uniref:Uncharacterized protein n=1 Tax=Marivirga sericea TaxID=1028 RepID=A0A1X7IAP1_9BACT|nr:hypothetical protein [Marivirga sericea]SMG11737.1 hypothetical protein SAMN05661096_00434 [Marivirga sericea]